MKQVRIQRKPRRHGGPGDGPSALLPTRPASDTKAAGDVLGRIDRLLDGR